MHMPTLITANRSKEVQVLIVEDGQTATAYFDQIPVRAIPHPEKSGHKVYVKGWGSHVGEFTRGNPHTLRRGIQAEFVTEGDLRGEAGES